jgi:hypothetical protein
MSDSTRARPSDGSHWWSRQAAWRCGRSSRHGGSRSSGHRVASGARSPGSQASRAPSVSPRRHATCEPDINHLTCGLFRLRFYLCHPCSCPEIEDGNARAGRPRHQGAAACCGDARASEPPGRRRQPAAPAPAAEAARDRPRAGWGSRSGDISSAGGIVRGPTAATSCPVGTHGAPAPAVVHRRPPLPCSPAVDVGTRSQGRGSAVQHSDAHHRYRVQPFPSSSSPMMIRAPGA